MSGNVWEWVWDLCYRNYSSDSQTDPTGPDIGGQNRWIARVIRGGSCADNPWDARVSNRRYIHPSHRLSSWFFVSYVPCNPLQIPI